MPSIADVRGIEPIFSRLLSSSPVCRDGQTGQRFEPTSMLGDRFSGGRTDLLTYTNYYRIADKPRALGSLLESTC